MIQFIVSRTVFRPKKIEFIIFSLSVAIKQKRQNYGISEFVLSAFDYDGNVVGRFVDQQTGNLALRHHSCPNGASVRIKFQKKQMNIFFF